MLTIICAGMSRDMEKTKKENDYLGQLYILLIVFPRCIKIQGRLVEDIF